MPLVLAAIDLKLSPSYTEMQARQHRLDFLSKIIRHSETLYDVTDFVAAGTNHILHLAYLTTRNLFFPCPDKSARSSEAQWPRKQENGENNGPQARKTRPSRCERAQGWLDAFVRCPRAYLLISTSVDYSLSVGRLPYDSALPALVRNIPSIGAVTRLPWTMRAGSHNCGLKDQIPPHKMLTKIHQADQIKSRSAMRALPSDDEARRLSVPDTVRDRPRENAGRETQERRSRPNRACDADFQQLRPERSPSPQKRWVNLDFLDLADICEDLAGSTDPSSFSNLVPGPGSNMHNASHHAIENLAAQDHEIWAIKDASDSMLFSSIFHDTVMSDQVSVDWM